MKARQQSEQINPWTFRNGKSPLLQFSNKQIPKAVVIPQRSPLKNSFQNGNKDRLSGLKVQMSNSFRLPNLVQPVVNGTKERNLKGLNNILNDDQNTRFMPTYKMVKMSFNNPKKVKSHKNVPCDMDSLRQYTQNYEISLKKEQSPSKQYTKIHRYGSDQSQKISPLNSNNNLHKQAVQNNQKARSKTMAIQDRNDPTIKIMSLGSRRLQAKQSPQQRKKMSKQIIKLCDLRGELSSKLSMMKRTYNLKKIQKMLN